MLVCNRCDGTPAYGLSREDDRLLTAFGQLSVLG